MVKVVNNDSIEPFENTIVDIFCDTCLSLWSMAEKLRSSVHLYFRHSDSHDINKCVF